MKKVLVVDDILAMRLIVKDMLEELGFTEFEEAEDGDAALQVLRGGEIGLVVSDFNMSPRTGLELLKEVKEDPSLNTIPFIMVTSETDSSVAESARKMGVNAFMKKPIQFDALSEHVKSIVLEA